MASFFNKIAEKVGVVVQGGTVNIAELRLEADPLPTRPRHEQILLKQVKAEVESRLSQTLHYQILINLDKDLRLTLVRRSWDSEQKLGPSQAESLPPETNILDIFERSDVNGKLLIVGEPGAGKTTALLELAKALLDRGEFKPEEAIPIIVSIPSWQDDDRLILDWLLDEIKAKYGVPQHLAKNFISQNRLVFCLDGLDELSPSRQELFIRRLNLFIAEDFQPQFILVSCRQKEYLHHQERLRLNAAIVCQPLAIQQLEDYFAELRKPDLIKLISDNEYLLDLLRTPLFLNIFIGTYGGLSSDKLAKLKTTEAYRLYLLDSFVEQAFARLDGYFKSQLIGANHLKYRHWLSWMAKVLEEKAQSDFVVDQIQPRMLRSESRIRTYNLIVNGMIGLTLFLACFGSLGALISIVLSLLIYFISLISPLNTPVISRVLRSQIYVYTAASWTLSLIGSIFLGHFPFPTINLILGLLTVLCFLASGLGGLTQNRLIEMVKVSGLSFRRGFKELYLSALGGLVSVVWAFLVLPFNSRVSSAESALIISILFLGCTSLFLIAYGIVGRLFLPIEDLGKMPGLGLARSLQSSRMALLFFGLTFSLAIIGLFGPPMASAIACPVMTPEEFKTFDLRNFSLLYDLLDLHLDYPCNRYIMRFIVKLMLFSPLISFGIFGFYFGFIFGGVASLQHLILRLMLVLDGHIPLNYPDFLEACNQCLLLQRTGGRYRFIHRLLQEHFAAMGLERPQI